LPREIEVFGSASGTRNYMCHYKIAETKKYLKYKPKRISEYFGLRESLYPNFLKIEDML